MTKDKLAAERAFEAFRRIAIASPCRGFAYPSQQAVDDAGCVGQKWLCFLGHWHGEADRG